jgi:hypothetical protein
MGGPEAARLKRRLHMTTTTPAPRLDELVQARELHKSECVSKVFSTAGRVEWELRMHRRDYIEGGALFEIGGRLMVHPERFSKVALSIGARKAAGR